MSQFIKRAVSVLAVSSILLSGCGTTKQASINNENQNQTKKVKVVTTFYPMYEFAKNVAGNNSEVVALIPAGVEPHDWEPTAKDMKMIQEADVFIYNGAGLESWVDKVLENIKNDNLKVVEASQGLDLMKGVDEEENHSLDPHVWLDPVLAQKEVKAIENALEQADPNHKDQYKTNANAYLSKLQELDKDYKEVTASSKRKEFITQHAAFGYLAKRYGLEQIPIAGLSPEEDPSPGKMGEIVKFAREHQVKTIFFETLVSPKVADTIAREIGAQTAVLNPIEGLTDEDKAKKLDYLGLMKKNLEELKKALNE